MGKLTGAFAGVSAWVLGMALMPVAANASSYLVQFDELTAPNTIWAYTYKDGVEVQNGKLVDGDYYPSGYQFFTDGSGVTPGLLADINYSLNIWEDYAGGTLSDTWQIFGLQGVTSLSTPYYSDTGLVLLTSGTVVDIIETGGFQTVLQFSVSNGDVYTWQFRSDAPAVPIPAALPLFAAGLGAMGFMGWRRRKAVLAA